MKEHHVSSDSHLYQAVEVTLHRQRRDRAKDLIWVDALLTIQGVGQSWRLSPLRQGSYFLIVAFISRVRVPVGEERSISIDGNNFDIDLGLTPSRYQATLDTAQVRVEVEAEQDDAANQVLTE